MSKRVFKTELDQVNTTLQAQVNNSISKTIVDAKGDIVTASAADTPIRLAVGTNEHRLVADSATTSGLKYVADTTNYAVGAKGDLLVGTAADTVTNLAVASTAGWVLTVDSATTSGLKWAAAPSPSYAWQTWTPSYTAITVGNGTVVARYAQVDKIVYVFWRLVCGNTSSWSNDPRFTLPVNYNRQASINLYGIGGGSYYDSSVGNYSFTNVTIDNTTAYLHILRTDSTWATDEGYSSSNGRPATAGAADGDIFYAQFWYEVA